MAFPCGAFLHDASAACVFVIAFADIVIDLRVVSGDVEEGKRGAFSGLAAGAAVPRATRDAMGGAEAVSSSEGGGGAVAVGEGAGGATVGVDTMVVYLGRVHRAGVHVVVPVGPTSARGRGGTMWKPLRTAVPR